MLTEHQNALNSIEWFTLKWQILYYVNFSSIIFFFFLIARIHPLFLFLQLQPWFKPPLLSPRLSLASLTGLLFHSDYHLWFFSTHSPNNTVFSVRWQLIFAESPAVAFYLFIVKAKVLTVVHRTPPPNVTCYGTRLIWPHPLLFCPLPSLTPITAGSLLPFQHSRHTPASGPLHLLFAVFCIFPPPVI